MRLDARFGPKAISDAVLARAMANIDEMRPVPGAAGLPGESGGNGAADLRRQVGFA